MTDEPVYQTKYPQLLRGNPAWKKGKSGNPAGKPKGTLSRVTQALDAIGSEGAEDILRMAVAKAKKGDAAFTDIILKRLWPVRKGSPIQMDLLPPMETARDTVKALAIVMRAVARGELTPDEGKALADIVEMQRKAIETSDIADRLTRLEQAAER